jgi:hypothetical protein
MISFLLLICLALALVLFVFLIVVVVLPSFFHLICAHGALLGRPCPPRSLTIDISLTPRFSVTVVRLGVIVCTTQL